ncbi:MAG: GGDEF domain-containing protein, partial [Salaquimonas sp.]
GEEFCILLPGASADQAKEVAERCRQEFYEKSIDGMPSEHPISASFGIALWRKDDDYQKLFRRADQGLFIAKNSGKNRIVPA